MLIIDAGDIEENNGLNLCYKIKNNVSLSKSKIIVTSSVHDKELVLNTGADLYMPKPYDVSALIKWVDSLMRDYNA